MMRAALLLLVLATAVAHADGEPWKKGVTAEQQQAAKKLLDEGNELLLQRDWNAALAKYQQAIHEWDHPGIRFNIVKCLVQLDRTLEAVDNLELALQYGAAPLDETVYGEALAYQKMLANEVSSVSVSCKDPIDITLDGQPLGTCPGTAKRRVLPGPHQIVGKRAGFLTRTLELVVLGGKEQSVPVTLEPLTASGKVVRRWASWVPWAVVGSGVAVGAAGGILDARAFSNRDAYNAAVQMCGTQGCDPDYRSHLQDTALLENRVSIGMFVAGGAAIVTGGVMLYMNRARIVYPDRKEQLMPTASVTPTGATLGVTGRF